MNITKQLGLSLVELMVSITLGLLIITSLGYILISNRSNYVSQDALARLQETGRLVLDTIGRDLKLAGRVAITPITTDTRLEWSNSINPIEGTDGGQDTITIRFQLDDSTGDIEDCNGHEGSTLDATKTPIGATGVSYSTVENIYSIDQDIANGVVTSTSLLCDGNGGTSAQPLADNVEDLQILYGVDTDGDDSANQFHTATQLSSSSYTWSQVVSVSVCVLLRTDSGATATNQTYIDCSGADVVSTDTRMRRAFTSIFTLRNRNNSSN